MNKRYLLFITLTILSVSSVFSQNIEKTWVGGGVAGVWEDDLNWMPAGAPTDPDDDILIDGAYSVTVSSTSTIKSIQLKNGADLTIAATYTLSVVSGNSAHDGIDLENTGASLTVNGTLNSSGHKKNGIDINTTCSLTINAGGTVSISNVTENGIQTEDNIVNNGTIMITNSTKDGMRLEGSLANRTVTNAGSISISGAANGISQSSNDWLINNNGTITLSNATAALIDNGTNLDHFGTLKGDGLVLNGDGNDVVFKSGSIIEPGTSTGTLTFSETVNLSDVTLNMEIDGAMDFDKIIVNAGTLTNGDVTLSNTTLNLTGSYTPVGGEEFILFEKQAAGDITGTFNGIPEAGMIEFNGALFTISYMGGIGSVTFDSALPIELLDFSARALKDEVKLSWTTVSEVDNDFFTIERSTDGRNFEEIAKILGNGTTTEISKYSYMDRNPESGLNYYRLKQTDFDGEFSYSDLETVTFETEETIRVFPTIVNDFIYINSAKGFEDDLTVTLRDLTGRVFKQFSIDKNEPKVELQLADLIPGSYFITIYNNESIQTYKIIKL